MRNTMCRKVVVVIIVELTRYCAILSVQFLLKYSNSLYLSPAASLPIAKFRVFLQSTKLRPAEHTELIPEV